MFYFGAGVTAVLIPVVFFVVPESVHWLARKQPAGALRDDQSRPDAHGPRAGRGVARRLAPMRGDGRSRTSSRPASSRSTVIVTLAYFFHITTFYFIVKWIPKIVVDLGFAAVVCGRRAGVDQRRRRDSAARCSGC